MWVRRGRKDYHGLLYIGRSFVIGFFNAFIFFILQLLFL